jgi:hypothetical protein
MSQAGPLMLDHDTYYSPAADMAYFSASQCLHLMECQAAELARLRGEYRPEVTEAMLVGSYVDRALTAPAQIDDWIEAHKAAVFTGRGQKRTAFERADAMIARLTRDPLAAELLAGANQVILTGSINGHPFKAQLDCLKADRRIFVDLKTVATFEPVWTSQRLDDGTTRNTRVPWYDHYWWQMAVYDALLREAYPDSQWLCILVAVTKQDPPDIGAWTLNSPDRMAHELGQGTANLGQWAAVKRGEASPRRCEDCAYCRQTKTLAIRDADPWPGRGRR